MDDDEQAVERANEAFYAAVRARDIPGMEALWSARGPVACVHPGWAPLHGRDAVLRSWRSILHSAAAPRIEPAAVVVLVMGEFALVTCRERLVQRGRTAGVLVATNTFRRDEGTWKMVHHHAGPLASGDEDEEDNEPDGGGGPVEPPSRERLN